MLELVTSGAKAPVTVGNIKKIGTGNADLAVLTTAGKLWVIGSSYFSGTGAAVTTWTNTATDVVDFCCAYRQVLIRKSDGTFWFMGYNNQFPTALGSTLTTFTDVTSYLSGPLSGKTIKKMVMGYQSLAIICTDGTVVLSGNNQSGSMGVGNSSPYRTPTLRTDLSDVADVQFDPLTVDTTYYLTNAGALFGAGESIYGNLGVGSSALLSFRRINGTTNVVKTFAAGSSGLLFLYRNTSNNAGFLAALGRQFGGSLGTGSQTDTSYTSSVNIVNVSATQPDLTVVAGTYHARYWFDNTQIYFTGSGGVYIGGGSVFNSTKYSFTAMPVSAFPWEQYAQNQGTYVASYVLSGGKLYGAGTYQNGNLPGYTSNQQSYVLLDTSLVT